MKCPNDKSHGGNGSMDSMTHAGRGSLEDPLYTLYNCRTCDWTGRWVKGARELDVIFPGIGKEAPLAPLEEEEDN